MKLIFVRHGEPNYVTDSLTETGKIQAEAVSQRLINEGISEIYASSNGRAKETASYLAEKLNKPISVLDYMHEIHWGAKEGCELPCGGHPWNVADQMASENTDFFDFSTQKSYYDNSLAEGEIKKVAKGIDNFLAGQGFKREGKGYRCVKQNEKNVALFSHGGSSTAALSHILNLPFLYLCCISHPKFTSITVLEFNENGKIAMPRILLMNDSRHIEDNKGYFEE